MVDDNTLFEIMPTFAPNIVCGFARVEGRTVGVSWFTNPQAINPIISSYNLIYFSVDDVLFYFMIHYVSFILFARQ